MTALADMTSSGEVVLVAPDVLRDMAAALGGLWSPDAEEDPERRDLLVAAARIRLYADRDRCGWYLVSGAEARDAVLRREDADWNVGFVAPIEEFDDAPAEADLAALVQLLRHGGEGEHLDAEAATSLALAILTEPVTIVVTREPRAYRHQRVDDLPRRLQLLTPAEVVERLELGTGEQPPDPVPTWNLLSQGPAWWVPA